MAKVETFQVNANDVDTSVHVKVEIYDRSRNAGELQRYRARVKGELLDALRRSGFNVEQIDIKNLKPGS